VRPLAWATAAVACYAIWDYGRVAARVAAQALPPPPVPPTGKET
jgi:hypothetical protein